MQVGKAAFRLGIRVPLDLGVVVRVQHVQVLGAARLVEDAGDLVERAPPDDSGAHVLNAGGDTAKGGDSGLQRGGLVDAGAEAECHETDGDSDKKTD